jgi:hypothetical protein
MVTSSTSSADRYVRSDVVVSRLIAGETLVVPVRGGVGDLASIYTFNPAGTTIWAALDRPKDLEELARLIEQEYEVSGSDARADVVMFLNEMRATGLVTMLNGDSGSEAAAPGSGQNRVGG